MKCSDIKLMLMDFLYGEISDEDKALLQDHLAQCSICHDEVEALQHTSKMLQHWEDVDPRLNLVFVHESQSVWSRLIQWLPISSKKLAYGLAIGFAIVIMLLSIANIDLSYREGHFSLKMGLLPRKEIQPTSTPNDELIAQIQQQNLQLMTTLIQQSEERQRKQVIATLTEFSRDIENRRTADLRLVGAGLDEIEKSVYTKLQKQTNNQLNNLIRYINTQQGYQLENLKK